MYAFFFFHFLFFPISSDILSEFFYIVHISEYPDLTLLQWKINDCWQVMILTEL